MAVVHYSLPAETDLDSIARFTKRKWGIRQASIHIDTLTADCERLAANPGLGRRAGAKMPEIRRMECGSHVILYEPVEGGILVGRILHKRMLAKRYAV